MRSARSQLIVIILATLPLFAAAAPPQSRPGGRVATRPAVTQPALAITYGPYLQAPSENGVTICWMTSRKCVSAVEYAEGETGRLATAVSSHFGLVDANVNLHTVRLTGLKPGARYAYRVVSREIIDQQAYKVVFGDTIRSEPRVFNTLDPRKPQFSFVILNDRHEKLPELTAALGKIDWPGVDLVFYNGDMVNDLRTEQQLMRCVVEPSTFAAGIPFVYIRGNHDSRGPFARVLMNYFPTDTGRFYYSFDHGGVHFTILDCGEDKADTSEEYFGLVNFAPYIAEETRWLKSEIQSPAFRNAKFRVVLTHIPAYPLKQEKFPQEDYVLKNWMPLLEEGKADLMLSGHTHRFELSAGQAGVRSFPMLVNGTNSVVRVDVKGDEMELSMRRDDGTELRPAMRIKRR